MNHDCRLQVAGNCAAIRHRPSELRTERKEADQPLAFDEETGGAENEDVERCDLPRPKRCFGEIMPCFKRRHRAVHLIDAPPVHASLIPVMPCMLGMPPVERNAHYVSKH